MGTLIRVYLLVVAGTIGVASAESPLPEPDPILTELVSESTSRAIDQTYFLPRNTIPFHYFIHLITSIHENDREFQASVEVHFSVLESTSNITMHAQELDILLAQLYKIPTEGEGDPVLVEQLKISFDPRVEHVVFTCQEALELGRYFIKAVYTGTMRNYQSGYHVSSYRNDDGEERFIGATHFQATLARRVFPCYDEPDLKATVSLWITHSGTYGAVANMPIDSVYPDVDKPGYHLTKFRTSPRMSTYLVAFAVTDFSARSNGAYAVLARPNAIGDADLALEAGEKILSALNQYTGSSYFDNMPKMTQIAIPDRGTGAMENWGLVAYGEPALLFNPEVNSYRNRKRVTTVIAHEFAHQWFGNLVSPRLWDYVWLSEGFATLYEYYTTIFAYPLLDYWELFNVEVVHRALSQDASDNIRAMNHPAASMDEIWRLFDVVAYQKSASVLNMFRQVIGDEAWKTAITSYIGSRQQYSATPDDLYSALHLAIERLSVIPPSTNIKEIMESWTNAPGYPVLNVRRLYKTGEIIISQERFYADKSLPGDHVWSIPYNYLYRDGPRAVPGVQWLTSKAAKLSTTLSFNQWIIFNGEQFGYYRVNYDEQNWELIIDALLNNPQSIHRANRAQLIDDAFNLARANRLDMSVVLRLMVYLRNEMEYAPWAAANNVLNYFYEKLHGTAHYDAFVKFVNEIISENYKTFVVADIAVNESTLHKYLKQIITSWACRLGNEDCLEKSYAAFRREVDTRKRVHPDVAAVVYCNAMRVGDHTDLSYLLPKMAESKNQAERSDLITALGCTNGTENIGALLTVIQLTGQNFLSTEKSQIIDAILAGGRNGINAMIQFIMTGNNANNLFNVLGEETFNSMIVKIAALTYTKSDSLLLEQTLERLDLPSETMEAAKEKVKSNVDWFNSLEGLVAIEFYDNFSSGIVPVK